VRRTDKFCILTLVSGCHNDCHISALGIVDTFLDIFVVVVAAQAEVNDLCTLVHGIADPVSHSGGISSAGSVHDTDRQDLDIDAGRAVDDRPRDVCSVAVFIRGIAVIVHEVPALEDPSLHLRMAGDTAVHDGDLDRLAGIRLDKSRIFIRLDIGDSPGHARGRGACRICPDGRLKQDILVLPVGPSADLQVSRFPGLCFGRDLLPGRGTAIDRDLFDLRIPRIQGTVVRVHVNDCRARRKGFRRFSGIGLRGKLYDTDSEGALDHRGGPVSGEIHTLAVPDPHDQAAGGVSPHFPVALHREAAAVFGELCCLLREFIVRSGPDHLGFGAARSRRNRQGRAGRRKEKSRSKKPCCQDPPEFFYSFIRSHGNTPLQCTGSFFSDIPYGVVYHMDFYVAIRSQFRPA